MSRKPTAPRILGADGKKLPAAPTAKALSAPEAEFDLCAYIVGLPETRPHVFGRVAVADFEDKRLAHVWEVASIQWARGDFRSKSYWELDKALRTLTGGGELEGIDFGPLLVNLDLRCNALHSFVNKPYEAEALSLAKLVSEASNARAVVAQAGKVQDAAMSGQGMRIQLAELQRVAARTEWRDFSSLDESLLVDFNVKPPLPLPTGYRDLDRDLGGGMSLGTFNVLAGGTGIGKTGFVLDVLLHNCRQQTHCLYLGTELTRQQITARIAAKYLNIDFRDVEKWGGHEDVGRIQAAVPPYVAKYLRFYRVEAGDSPAAIVDSYIAKTVHKPLVVVDHAGDLIRQSVAKAALAGKLVDTVAATSQISLELRELTVRQNICVLAIMPTARGMPKELDPETQTARVFEACARGSSDVEYDASNLFYLLRKDENLGQSKLAEAYLAIAKNRRGPNSILKFRFHIGTGVFENIGTAQNTTSDLGERIIRTVRDNYTASLSQNALVREIGGSRDKVRAEITALLRAGRIIKTESGGYAEGDGR